MMKQKRRKIWHQLTNQMIEDSNRKASLLNNE
jgi:hypothetical protein